MSERFRPIETLRTAGYVIRLLGAEALAAIDKKLDWVPDDTKEEAIIKSRIWCDSERPVPTEEELEGQMTLPFWKENDGD